MSERYILHVYKRVIIPIGHTGIILDTIRQKVK